MRSTAVAASFLALVLAFSATACRGPAVDIIKALQVAEMSTGWFDAGVENGKNKLVPTITLTFKNASAAPVTLVQLNAIFRRTGETEEWGGAYVRMIGAEGLAPGASTTPIVLRSELGYTGIEPRAQMLQNHLFVDVNVQVFVKHGGAQWAKLGDWPVKRALLVK